MMPVPIPSFRQLLIFETVARTENVSQAASEIHVSQPAVTQAIARIERDVGVPLFRRRNTGCYLTDAGSILQRRTTRLFAELDGGLHELIAGTRRMSALEYRSIERKLSRPQVRALLGISENGTFAAAARALAMSEPSIHRAARELESIVGRTLFQRTAHGMIATGPAIEFARRTRLAIHELDFALEEIAASQGDSRSRIALGLLPLAGAFFIARALKDFSRDFPEACIEIIDGSFDFLIERLRSGRIDFIIGPRRGLNPSLGVVETALFDDSYALVVRCGHPLTRRLRIKCDDLLGFDWIAPPPDTPRRVAYDALLRTLERAPRSTLQTSSLGLTRAVLTETDCIALVSRYESRAEQDMGLLTVLPFEVPHRSRQIQVTTRADWLPTAAQERFLLTLRNQSGGVAPARPATRPRISVAGGNRAGRR